MFLELQDGKVCWLQSRDPYSKPRLKFAQKPALFNITTKSGQGEV